MTEQQRSGSAGGQPVEPLQVKTAAIIRVGTGLWALALVGTLAVPTLHSGHRDWWPWACVTGVVLGLVGLVYLRRGQGNAAGVEPR